MAEINKRKINKIGIVLSGGLARGACQLAFANELIKKIGKDKIALISASSIGSLNAYAIGSGTEEDLLNFYSKFDCDSTKSFKMYIRNRLFNKIFNIIESDNELNIPIYVTGTKLVSLQTYYFYLNKMERSEIKSALNISMSFPLINGPHRNRGGSVFIDGGATDNIPTYPMTYFDLDMVIILHCNPRYYPPQYLYNQNQLVIDVDTTLNLPKTTTSFSLEKDKFNEMIETGTKDGKEFANFVFSDFDYNEVKNRIYEYNKNHLKTRSNKSKDSLMSLVSLLNAINNTRGFFI